MGERHTDDEERIMMPNLPDDIVDNILMKLQVAKSICRFRCVSKHCCSLLKNYDFMNSRLKYSIETEKINCLSVFESSNYHHEFYMHITKSTSLYTVFESGRCDSVKMDSPFKGTSLEVEILGSSHGLILLRVHNNCYWRTTGRECQYMLWIPCTREFKEILIPKVETGSADYQKIDLDDVFSVTYGVNLDCDTNDYKIVVATCNGSYARGVCYGTEIQVYSSESNSWKTIPNIVPYEFTCRQYDRVGVIFVSGSFHWLARQLQSKRRLCIVSFDIHRENFNQVAVTPQVDDILNDYYYVHKALGVLGGCLCIAGAYGGLNVDVWVMKDYSVTNSWTKFYTVKLPEVVNSIAYVKILWEFKNGEVLFVTTNGENCCLVLYDPVSNKCQVTKIQHNADHKWNIEAYGERSPVSLNSIHRYSGKRPRREHAAHWKDRENQHL